MHLPAKCIGSLELCVCLCNLATAEIAYQIDISLTPGLAPTVYDKKLVEMRETVKDTIREVLTFRYQSETEEGKDRISPPVFVLGADGVEASR